MAEATIPEIMAAIQVRLNTISDLEARDHAPDQLNVPVAFVSVPAIPNYRLTMQRKTYEIRPTVTVLVSGASAEDGQYHLGQYMSPTGAKSILKAIEADRTLGGIVDDCIVDSFEPLGLERINEIDYFGGVFTLRVLARGESE